MAEEGCASEIVMEAVLNRDQATARKFLGSPTIRVNGIDIEPGSEARSDYALACRAYLRSDGRISPLPPPELIRDALSRAALRCPAERRGHSSHWRSYMSALTLGSQMPDFALDEPATGRTVASKVLPPQEPVVVVFTSNHCPHALAWEERILQLGRDYQGRVSMVMISANDPDQFPECSPDAIAERARERNYPMPYLFDADQDVALTYDAERTPDIFVFDADRRLVYHGTVDDNEEEPDQGQD
jgi:peroxiredoxin